MLTFIDESGHPHPNDQASRPVLASVSLAQRESRNISGKIYRVKRTLLGSERANLELKAHNLLKRSTFRRKPELRELVETVFDLLRDLPVTVFAVIMERPREPLPRSDSRLPRQYRHILQRVNAMLLDEPSSLSVVLIDGDGSQYGGLSGKIEQYLHRHGEGRELTNVVDSPYFVDSRFTVGIQLADLVAGVVRQYEEANLSSSPPADSFLSAIERYYRIIKDKSRDLPDTYGRYDTLIGLHRMSERMHYYDSEEDAEEVPE
jgi:hypothetical protein